MTAGQQGGNIAELVEAEVMMKKKLLIAAIVIAVLAASFAMVMLTVGAAIAVWIYLAWTIRKKKTAIFHEQMEPKLAEKRLKKLKTLLLVAAIAFIGGIGAAVLHNVIAGVSDIEEAVSFFIALGGLWAFILTTGGGLAVFLLGRQKPA